MRFQSPHAASCETCGAQMPVGVVPMGVPEEALARRPVQPSVCTSFRRAQSSCLPMRLLLLGLHVHPWAADAALHLFELPWLSFSQPDVPARTE